MWRLFLAAWRRRTESWSEACAFSDRSSCSPSHQLVGPDAWATAFGQTVDAFGNITSSLAGNISCKPVKNPKDALEPYMFCVAKHICTFELKSVSNSSGLPVTLEGEIMDTVWINGEGHIVKLHSDFDPRFFHVEGQNSTAPEDKDAEAKALMKSIVEGK